MLEWANGLAVFATSIATTNARALNRAGLLDEGEVALMHQSLALLREAASHESHHGMADALAQMLPPARE